MGTKSGDFAQSVGTEPPLLPNACYAFALLSRSLLVCQNLSTVVRWLCCSFAFFVMAVCVGKNENVQPKALAICQTYCSILFVFY